MQDIAAKISDSELEVLEVLWEAEEALPTALQSRLFCAACARKGR